MSFCEFCRRFALVVFLLIASLGRIRIALADTDAHELQVPQVGLSLTLPSGWTAMSESTLDRFSVDISARAPGAKIKRAIAGFQRDVRSPPGSEFPYILVQEQLSRTPTPEQLRAAAAQLNAQTGAQEVTAKSGGLFTTPGFKLSYDPASNSINGTMVIEMNGVQAAAHTRWIPTARGTVQINGYIAGPNRAASTALFSSIFDTARVESRGIP